MTRTIRPFHVRAPATSANLGPGFDAFGLALDWWDTLRVSAAAPGAGEGETTVAVRGDGADAVPAGPDNLVLTTMERVAADLGTELPRLRLELELGFPLGRGFGSSAAAIVLGLLAAREVLGAELSGPDLLALASELEGHPDNVAPCLAGGATLCWGEAGRPRCLGLPVAPELAALALVAEAPMDTQEARRLLPERVPFGYAVRTAGRAALLPLALGGDLELLLPATEDVLHQPRRLAIQPIAAHALGLLRARGHAAFLSGAGPSLLVLCAREALDQASDDAREALRDASGWRVEALAISGGGAAVELD
jgi:homoserine kinase